MTVQQIRALGPALARYLGEFDDCFINSATRDHLKHYVQGQLSNLPRKSVEPIAHLMDVPPRTLQEFLSLSDWDHGRLRDTVQRLVARDHAEEQAIGIIDESGHPKKGNKTATVHRDYCGASGKIDNCVMSVHLCYAGFDGRFRTMIDSDLYLPKDGWNDKQRRKEAGIPDSAIYRPKYDIALAQLRRALTNGVHLGWICADEWYGEKPAFIAGLEELGLRFVLEIPRNLMGWLYDPKDDADARRGQVQNLIRWSKPMLRQEWTDLHIKDTNTGAMVWEVKAAPFWMKRDGRVVGPFCLLAARDRLDQNTVKYFLSNAKAGVPLEVILHVAFRRWPVERCLEDEKSELGLSHFECRKYDAVLRHLRLTQVSHLFLARQTQRLAGKKSRRDDLPDARRGQRAAGCLAAECRGSKAPAEQGRNDHSPHAVAKRRGTPVAHPGTSETTTRDGHPCRETAVLYPVAKRIAL
jgi:SRSO17 transposase